MKALHKILFIAVAAMLLATQAQAVLFWVRPYDPNLGRWIQRDPMGELGGLNLYTYVENNPVSFIDPLGLQDGMGNPANVAALEEVEATAAGYPNAAAMRAAQAAEKAAETMAKQLAKEGEKSVAKACRSFEKRIAEHLEKIAKNPNSRDVNHWKKEIENWQRLKQAGEDLLKSTKPPTTTPPPPTTSPPTK